MGEEKTEELDARIAGGGAGNDRGNGLFERETEIAALTAALAAARSGAGGLVVLDGPAGIGKSRLLAEARAMADALGMTTLTARGIDLERDAPFGVVADLFAATLARADGSRPGAARDRLLSGQAALASALFDPVAPPAADSSALVRGLYWLTVNVAASATVDARTGGTSPGGVLIEVDDAQWADRPSLSYLAHLAARIDELPALLVVAVRSGEQATDQQTLDWLRDRAGRSLLRPRALSPEAIALIARDELPAAEPAFTRACAEVSGGNPFLATELLRAVLIRLARLGEPAEMLAKAVAVLGNRAPMRQAVALAGLAAAPAEQAADVLASAHIMAPGEPLRFTHPLIATSVYADIPAFARARAHRRVGRPGERPGAGLGAAGGAHPAGPPR